MRGVGRRGKLDPQNNATPDEYPEQTRQRAYMLVFLTSQLGRMALCWQANCQTFWAFARVGKPDGTPSWDRRLCNFGPIKCRFAELVSLAPGTNMAMGQNPVPLVNIPIPTKTGSKMGGAPTPKWYHWF